MEMLRWVGLGVLTFVLAGAAPARAADPAPMPINLGTLKIASQTDIFVAQQHGIFARNGLDAKLAFFNTGADAVNASQGGAVDVLLSIPGTGMTAMERGFDLVPIFQDEVAHAGPPDSASVQVLASSNLKTLADLVGKKIGVGALHTQNTVEVQTLLKRAGVALDAVQFVELPFPTQATALKTGQVDAVNPIDPFTTQLVTSGVGRVISWNYVESIPQQPLGVMFARGAFLKSNPKAVTAFVQSVKEAMDYLNADPDRARQEVVAFTGLDAALIKNMPLNVWDYHVRPEKWQAVIDLMVASGEMRKPHKAAEYFSDQIKPFVVQ